MNRNPLATVRKEFTAFRNESVWIQTCFNNFDALFSNHPVVEKTIRESAPLFFADLNRALIECWISGVCRVTDPARTGNHVNLSCNYLCEALDAQGLLSSEIRSLSASLCTYRAFVEDARNKYISHYDRDTIVHETPLGEHHVGHLHKFLQDLQAFNDCVGNAIGEGPLDYSVTSGPGDVLDLIRALRCAA
jgi:AbiU2